MRKRILAGNWKMNMMNQDLEGYFKSFKDKTSSIENLNDKVEMIFAGPYTLLTNLSAMTSKEGFKGAAQNCHFKDNGAYTGEVSLKMLSEIGIKTVIIGHSERRQYDNETNESVAQKVTAALDAGFMAIACVGESEAERKSDQTEAILKEQVTAIIEAAKDPSHLVIAYEPVWAIGTGLTASVEQAQSAHQYIRALMTETYGAELANKVRILYGGSMKPENIESLIAQKDIDGGLVGGASLKPEQFAAMAKIAAK